MEFKSTNTGTTAKLHILKLENGDSWVSVPQTAHENGTSVTKMSIPVTAKEKTNKKNDVKARSFPPEWNTHVVVWMNKPKVKTMSIDDLYNNFKIVEQKVKKSIGASSGAQNLAFMTALSTSSTNDANTASPQVSTASPNVNAASPQVSTTSFSDNVVYAFRVKNPNGSNLLHQDLGQIHEDDLEAMDLKWKLSLLSMRAKRYYQRTCKKIFINANDTVGYDKSKVECYNCHKLGHFARECRAPRSKEGQFHKSRQTPGCKEETMKTHVKGNVGIDGIGFDWILDEFKEPEFKGYGPENSEQESNVVCDKKSDNFKENSDESLVEEQINCNHHQRKGIESRNNYNRVDAKTTYPSVHRNMSTRAVLLKTGLTSLNTVRPVNITHPKSADFKEFDGGYVAFGGGAYGGRITSKGTLKTDSLDFEDATLDESMLWQRRLGHINFKNINKIVKDNLVRGLPTKHFENDQTCVACLKGKQHRASCKSEVPNPITKPLFMLHMDLFGLTFVSSLMHKKYCLVVTNDYSRFTWVFFLTTRDETSEILKNLIKEIENLVDKKVKIIRSDNAIEFKNKIMDDFCREKCIKREYNVARTPQQNGVAERRNRTLIEAARTMLANSKLPTTFWAEAVSTACYVQNKVLVVKPHNKTPYELFRCFKPALSFMKPFGCHVTILNTLDSLGKFDGKSDEGFFVGHSLSSKDFRVYNTRTSRVEENLHIRFFENKPMIEGNGPKWLFDIDSLTQSMNYVPVTAGIISNESAGTSEEISQDCIVMLIWKDTSYFDSPTKDVDNGEPKTIDDAQKQVEDGPNNENAKQDKFEDDSSTKDVNPAGQHVNTASPDVNTSYLKLNVVGPSVTTASSNEQDSPKDMFTMGVHPTLEATHIEFFGDEDEPKINLGNITNSYTVSTTPNTRIHKDHPIDNVINDVKSSVQIRRMTKPTSEQGFLTDVYDQKIHDTLNTCLYVCFLSQIEPTSIANALSDSSWVEAMLEELLQFKLQQVFRNKKDERGIVIRNKARLAAQGHRQEECIDYEEVFAHVARIKAIRLFLAYASFMGFLVYQMDVKSAFLYGTIKEEVYVTQPPGFKDPEHPDKVYKVVKALLWFCIQHKSMELCTRFEKLMKDKFQMSSMGELTFFLGLQVQQKKDGIFISQDKYVAEILKKFNYIDVKFASTPVDLEKPLVKDRDADDVDVYLYRSMIGSLMYLTTSRLDIIYLKGKPTLGLWYSRDSPFEQVAYTDSDYAGVTQDKKSTTGGSEYVAAASCCGQVLWIQNQLLDYGYNFMNTVINIDNNNLLTKGFDAGRFQYLVSSISKEVGTPRYLSLVVPLTKVGDEAVHKELGDRMERAATTASSLEAEQDSGSGPRCQDTILGDVNAQTRFEITSIQSIDPPLSRGYTLGSGEDSMKLIGIDEILLKLVLSVLVSAVKRMLMLPVQVFAVEVNGVRQIQALVDKKRVIVTESSIRRDLHLNDAEGTDCLPTATIFQELAHMLYEKPSQKLTFYKAFFSPQWKYYIHTITQCLSAKSTAWNEFSSSMASLIICLQLIRSSICLSKSLMQWFLIYKKQRMLKLRRLWFEEKDPKDDDLMFDTRVLEDDVMHVEAKVDGKDEQSTKPDDSTAGEAVTTASVDDSVQQLQDPRIDGWLYRSQVSSEFHKRHNLRRKRAGKEQQQKSSKKQKVEEEKESDTVDEYDEAELKKLLVIKKGKDIAIDAIPLATKLPVIIDYKLYKEGMMVHYQLIRADGSSKRHSLMIRMLQGIDREDLEALWRIVKANYGDTRPENEFERVLWGDLKVMFEPDKRSDVWRILQGYRVTIWKLISSSGVYFVSAAGGRITTV
ncbi:putative ribonuclease H-like domain-containing protein [Tanacetum coccineum]